MKSSHFPNDLAHVGDYAWPRVPATSSLRANARRLWEKLRVLEDRPADLLPDDLERLSDSLIPDDLWCVLRDYQYDRLDQVYLDWARRTDGPYSVCAFVTMPSAPPGLLGDWAKDRGLQVANSGADPSGAAVRGGQGALIVPDLSPLVRRSLDGRAAMRAYQSALDGAPRNVLLGVSSWAWTYLAQTSQFETVVSDARSFAAFDDMALAELIAQHMTQDVFRSAETGNDILTKDNNGALKDKYLKTLAARAFGCPWAALRLFDAAVNRQSDPKDAPADAGVSSGTGQTTWLQDQPAPELPQHIRRPAHFLLHALLIHGPLTPEDLRAVLPLTSPVGLASALSRAGLIDKTADKTTDKISLTANCYPHIRSLLSDAGFPVDRI